MQRFLGKLLRSLQLYRRINLVSKARVGETTFSIPLVAGLRCRSSDLWMLDVLKALLGQRQGAFVDIGVNLGQTLLKVRSVDPERTYFGFEPNPVCVAYLDHLVTANAFRDVTIIPAGVSDMVGLLKLHIYGGKDDPSASIVEGFRGTAAVKATRFVSLVSLPQFEAWLPSDIAVIKIDVEGAELEVLTTLAPLPERARPVVLIEVLPAYSSDNHARIDRQKAIESLLHTIGYAIHRIARSPDGGFARLEQVSQFGIHDDLNLCDYLVAPADQAIDLTRRFPQG
jgi:FkbM family methyltransferase